MTEKESVQHQDTFMELFPERLRQARKANNLTQEQLGERIGVQKAQISRLERGKNVTITSMMRVFRAMNITATLEISGVGKVALC